MIPSKYDLHTNDKLSEMTLTIKRVEQQISLKNNNSGPCKRLVCIHRTGHTQETGQGILRTQDRAYSGQGLLRTQDMAYTGHRTGHTQDRAYSGQGIIRTGHEYAGHMTGHTQGKAYTGQRILRTGLTQDT